MTFINSDLSPEPVHKLRIAVIGCGAIGMLHAEAVRGSSQAELCAACDVDAPRRAIAAQRFGVPAYETVEKLLAGEKLDAVTIATPDHLHVEPALAALAAGCHVFCEKPLAADVAEAERIVAAAATGKRHVGVNYNRRFAFGYRMARQLLDQQRIGKLDYAWLRVSDGTPSAAVARHSHVIFTTLLTHHLDLLRWYCGEVGRIQAHAGGNGVGLLRNVTLTLEHVGGATGTIAAHYRDQQSRTAEWLELGGARGTMVVDDMTRGVSVSTFDPDCREVFEPDLLAGESDFYGSIGAHLQKFIVQIASGAGPPVSARDGLMGLKLAAAAVRSLETGLAVDVLE